MKAIDHLLNDIYLPLKALMIYKQVSGEDNNLYVESYDMDETGKPINAHPLSVEECNALSQAFDTSSERDRGFLISKGLLPEKLLYLYPSKQGHAIWYTPPRQVKLFFKESLTIPCGLAHIPAMVWKADREYLHVFAIKGHKKPLSDTPLYHAPYFNLYEDGKVCMGTVDINIEKNCCLEDFMSLWEQYFFSSYFSHLLEDTETVKGNIVQLWQQQVGNSRPFPENVLIKNGQTLKSILS
jgi:PRTRC genetic system protein B